VDHIVPVARGGCANIHNLQKLCAHCNHVKSAKMPPPGIGCPVVNPSAMEPN
jgi:5-methylcytosine-specific restriction endonuclease McrA